MLSLFSPPSLPTWIKSTIPWPSLKQGSVNDFFLRSLQLMRLSMRLQKWKPREEYIKSRRKRNMPFDKCILKMLACLCLSLFFSPKAGKASKLQGSFWSGVPWFASPALSGIADRWPIKSSFLCLPNSLWPFIWGWKGAICLAYSSWWV